MPGGFLLSQLASAAPTLLSPKVCSVFPAPQPTPLWSEDSELHPGGARELTEAGPALLLACSILGLVEIKTNQMRNAKSMYSECAVAWESATETFGRLTGWPEEWEVGIVKSGRLRCLPGGC
jgi:hypothetical protein